MSIPENQTTTEKLTEARSKAYGAQMGAQSSSSEPMTKLPEPKCVEQDQSHEIKKNPEFKKPLCVDGQMQLSQNGRIVQEDPIVHYDKEKRYDEGIQNKFSSQISKGTPEKKDSEKLNDPVNDDLHKQKLVRQTDYSEVMKKGEKANKSGENEANQVLNSDQRRFDKFAADCIDQNQPVLKEQSEKKEQSSNKEQQSHKQEPIQEKDMEKIFNKEANITFENQAQPKEQPEKVEEKTSFETAAEQIPEMLIGMP